MEESKKCKFCGEVILAIAIKCKHCNSMLNENVKPETFELEKILADKAANLFRGIEAVGGRIMITNKAIKFKSHALNLQTMDLTIPLHDISKIGKRNTMGLVPNGLLITLKSGLEYKFVLWNRDEIITVLNEHIN